MEKTIFAASAVCIREWRVQQSEQAREYRVLVIGYWMMAAPSQSRHMHFGCGMGQQNCGQGGKALLYEQRHVVSQDMHNATGQRWVRRLSSVVEDLPGLTDSSR